MTLRLLSLCSGIGAIDYVWSSILGQEIAGQVEIKPYCQEVLTAHWPNVPKVSDIKEITDHDPFGPVDLVAGGIPCQPFSTSGQRRGTTDDRHLWPFAFALVQRRRPTWVLIENVTGFVSLALDLVQADLESAHYQSRAYVLPACAVGASHIRERVFILAYTSSGGLEIGQRATQLSIQSGASDPRLADADSDRQWNWTDQPQRLPSCYRTPNTGTDGTQRTLAQSLGAATSRTHWQLESGVGGVLNGLAYWVDGAQWPALPGEPQRDWEPPRTVVRKVPYHDARLEALGNTIVPQQMYPFLAFIVAYHQRVRGGVACPFMNETSKAI